MRTIFCTAFLLTATLAVLSPTATADCLVSVVVCQEGGETVCDGTGCWETCQEFALLQGSRDLAGYQECGSTSCVYAVISQCAGGDLGLLWLPLPYQVYQAGNTVDSTLYELTGQDSDEDGYGDTVEETICGRDLVRQQVNGGTVPGDCSSSSNYDFDNAGAIQDAVDTATGVVEDVEETVAPYYGIVEGLVNDAIVLVSPYVDLLFGLVADVYGMLDGDGDFVPDASEPTMCQIENQNTPVDGSCTGNDYHP